jgi:D-alanine transaminase
MKDLGYYNGKFGPLAEMTVPMTDRACYFGDGVYEATLTRNHIPYALEEHVDRMFSSAGMLRIEMPCTKEDLTGIIREMVRKVDDDELMAYWQVSRGAATRSHPFPAGNVQASLWIMLSPLKRANLDEPVGAITAEDTRFLHCNIKTLNLIPSVMAAQKAVEAGCYEAILHRSGRVTECAHSNVHILKDGMFITAPLDNLILPGIERKHLLGICGALGIPVKETPYTVHDLLEADEVLISSSAAFCLRVAHVDGRTVGGKAAPLVKQLQDAALKRFMEYTTA